MRRQATAVTVLALVGILGPAPRLGATQAIAAESEKSKTEGAKPEQHQASGFHVSPPLRDLEAGPPKAGFVVEREMPIRRRATRRALQPAVGDATTQASPVPSRLPLPTISFEGLRNSQNGSVNGFLTLPPDTNGDVGPVHYVQTVNNLVQVFDKKTGKALLPSPKPLGGLFASLGGSCADTYNSSDPVVLYDHLADRWVLGFAGNVFAGPPFYQCVAVSKTNDPTGSYFLYVFRMPNDWLNDYAKLGVWPDAYYMTDNQFQGNTFVGVGVLALDRTKMLAGDATAGFLYVNLGAQASTANLFGMLPADLDGQAPPLGTPGYFLVLTAPEFGDTADALRLFQFHVDFSNPSASTWTERPESPIPTAHFNPNLCNFQISCIPQPRPGPGLDPLSDWLLYRLQYRNLGSAETLVVTHTVNASPSGKNLAGIRYYEVVRTLLPGTSFGIQQQGTFAPDTNQRWMGSAAIDKQGNLLVGYSVSSKSLFPSIRYAGRAVGDPPGLSEATLQTGGGAQTSSSHRWGDYTMLSVDPVDNCTFWYTNEYYAASSNLQWQTRIGSVKFPSCQ